MRLTAVLLCALPIASASAQQASFPPPPVPGPPILRPLLFDRDLTMESGTETVVTLQQGLARAEDRYLRTRWFDESGGLGKAGGFAGRLAKLLLLDRPMDHFTVVLAHEFMGHGARYRELDISNVDYGYDLPPPYGAGGGQASANLGEGVVSRHEHIAIWTGGLESHQILSRTLGLQWTERKRLSYRDASLFFESWLIAQDYIQGTEAHLAPGEGENDLNAYVRLVNARAGYTDPDDLRMTVGDLKDKARLDFVHPMLWTSLYTIVKTYLWDGTTTSELPMVRIGRVGYLPGLRMGLTPFGLEYHVDNYLRWGRRAALVDVRVGDTSFHDGWGGVGVRVRKLWERTWVSIDVDVDLWKQPGLELGRAPTGLKGQGFGGAASVRCSFAPGRQRAPVWAVVELGYKSAGFLEGRRLDAAPIVMAGIAGRW
jgi:hypothetical protein